MSGPDARGPCEGECRLDQGICTACGRVAECYHAHITRMRGDFGRGGIVGMTCLECGGMWKVFDDRRVVRMTCDGMTGVERYHDDPVTRVPDVSEAKLEKSLPSIHILGIALPGRGDNA